MLKNLLFTSAIGFLMASCGGKTEKLESQLDSLKNELQTSQPLKSRWLM
ncbi:MAG: hypothetical protein ACKO96_46170 [Flammeovirgaceae bacterium]